MNEWSCTYSENLAYLLEVARSQKFADIYLENIDPQ